jgi:4-amino-4-deoxy-L-arabinose transferase-like glycosyltransferase
MARFLSWPHLPSIGVSLFIGGFVFVAAQQLATFPLPNTDESMTLQVPYEMLNRGKLAFPMYQFVGGNIENSWHSFTPVFFLMLSSFLKVVGWGLVQGRAFNLGCAAVVLLLVYLIGSRLVDRKVGFIAVALIISDPLFLTRSRLVRNDLLAQAFGMLAYYLYDCATKREKKKYYLLGSGLAAGAAVMCHTNLIYILGVIGVLMLLKQGVTAARSKGALLFGAGALAVMSYEIVYDLLDYQNFVLQNRRDRTHFRVFDLWGWWSNLRDEPRRYVDWYQGSGIEFVPQFPFQRVYLLLTLVAIVYLIARAGMSLRRSRDFGDPRVRILISTLVVILFFALITQRKVTQYIVYLTPWFGLCAGTMLRDGVALIGSLRTMRWRWAATSYAGAATLAALVVVVYFYQLGGRNVPAFLSEMRDPDLASFDEIREVLRSAVPGGLCPAAIGNGYLWLAFPEHDRCFLAHMEHDLDERLGLDGKDYALFVRPKSREKMTALTEASAGRYHLLAELHRTAYGTFNVYYTGNDSRYQSLPTRRYYFFGLKRGHVSEDDIAAGRDVWTVAPPPDKEVTAAVELKPNTVYRLNVEDESHRDWAVELIDDATGAAISQMSINAETPTGAEIFFKTGNGERVRLAVRSLQPESSGVISISRIRIREIVPVRG